MCVCVCWRMRGGGAKVWATHLADLISQHAVTKKAGWGRGGIEHKSLCCNFEAYSMKRTLLNKNTIFSSLTQWLFLSRAVSGAKWWGDPSPLPDQLLKGHWGNDVQNFINPPPPPPVSHQAAQPINLFYWAAMQILEKKNKKQTLLTTSKGMLMLCNALENVLQKVSEREKSSPDRKLDWRMDTRGIRGGKWGTGERKRKKIKSNLDEWLLFMPSVFPASAHTSSSGRKYCRSDLLPCTIRWCCIPWHVIRFPLFLFLFSTPESPFASSILYHRRQSTHCSCTLPRCSWRASSVCQKSMTESQPSLL